MLCLNVGRVKIKLRVSFVVIIFLFQIFYPQKSVEIFFNVCLIHELGHFFAFILLGERIKEIIFSARGIILKPQNLMRSFMKDIIILLAGAFFNFIAGVICICYGGICEVGLYHIFMGIIQLLPYSFFDGGEIIEIIIKRYSKNGIDTVGKKYIIINFIFTLFIFYFLFLNDIRNPIFFVVAILGTICSVKAQKRKKLF